MRNSLLSLALLAALLFGFGMGWWAKPQQIVKTFPVPPPPFYYPPKIEPSFFSVAADGGVWDNGTLIIGPGNYCSDAGGFWRMRPDGWCYEADNPYKWGPYHATH